MSLPFYLLALFFLLFMAGWAYAELRVPAFTAYVQPDGYAARVSPSGITRWRNPTNVVRWHGEMTVTGRVDAAVTLRLPTNAVSKLRLTVGTQAHEATARSAGPNEVRVNFGTFDIARTGYFSFTLESLNTVPKPIGDISALLLDGPATKDAHFNLQPRRNAASVHLFYPTPAGTEATMFYSEVTALEEPVGSFYMACGWHRGYFGMQVNSRTERRIIFSVWDSSDEQVSRANVKDEDRVQLVARGDRVLVREFGNEGTGGHSHLIYPWKTGEPQRFIVTAQATNNNAAIFAGYWFHPEQQRWILISAWLAPKAGSGLRDLHSFSEDFEGSNSYVVRKARYGNQWLRTASGQWTELTAATFSHDETGKQDRHDRFMGVENGQFFLQHGGFVPGYTAYGERFTRPLTGQPPVLDLPKLPLPN